MKPVDSVMLALGAGAIVMAALEWMGMVQTRVEPPAFVLIALVCVGRVLLRIKLRSAARQRQMMIDEIPKRPLGLVDGDPAEPAPIVSHVRPAERPRDPDSNPLLKDVPKRPLGLD